VVIGVLDMHGKPEEAAAIADFERVGSVAHGELDLDAVLGRRPQVVVVDDLAHANPAGSRHPKRWNDVDEILARASTSSPP
jgi:two-component system sensor histidine kinase KdpD